MRLILQRPHISLWIINGFSKHYQRRWLRSNSIVGSVFSWPIIQLQLTTRFTCNLDHKRNVSLSCIVADDQSVESKKLSKSNKDLKAIKNKENLYIEKTFSVSSGPIGERYYSLIRSFEVLSKVSNGSDAPLTNIPIYHEINTSGKPIARNAKTVEDEKQRKKIERNIEKLLDLEIVRPSTSKWTNTLSLAKNFRDITGNYVYLNACTVPDSFPLPVVEDMLTQIKGQVFSVLKLKLNLTLHQIPIAEKDIEKTAVITPFGLFEFLRMPAGLRNTPQTLQKFMNHVLMELPFVKCYVDEVLVFSNSHQSHFRHLSELFEVLQSANVKINWKECNFGTSNVSFVDYHVDADGFKPNTRRAQAILNFPLPKDSLELHQFLRLMYHYSRCIPKAHESLQKLANCNETVIKWTQEAIDSFQECKNCLAEATTFVRSRDNLVLRTNLSQNNIVGATLDQEAHEGKVKPLGFYSARLRLEPEYKFNKNEQKFAAVYDAVKFFERMLKGRKFTIYTNISFVKKMLVHPSYLAEPKHEFHLNFLSQFNYSVTYSDKVCNFAATSLCGVKSVVLPAILDAATLIKAQSCDQQLSKYLEKSSLLFCAFIMNEQKVHYLVENNVAKLYIPNSLRRKVFSVYHDNTHESASIIFKKISRNYFWPDMESNLISWIRSCEVCCNRQQQTNVSSNSKT